MKRTVLWIWIAALVLCGQARSLEADLTLQQLNHRAYTVAAGAPGTVRAIAQTNDGTLWLGGYAGLARFDGRDFVHYPGPLDDPLPSPFVTALIAAPDGGLW